MIRSEDALRRALTQAASAEAQEAGKSQSDPGALAYARGAVTALQWALGDSEYDPWGGVGIHEIGDRSLYQPSGPPGTRELERTDGPHHEHRFVVIGPDGGAIGIVSTTWTPVADK